MIPKFRVYAQKRMFYQPFKNGEENIYLIFHHTGGFSLGTHKKNYRNNEFYAVATSIEGQHGYGTLMQSTGQFDMDGVEIYEGDIVAYFIGGINLNIDDEEGLQVDESVPFEGYHTNEIIFDGGYFGVKSYDTSYEIWDSSKRITVLGNKYENPELLDSLDN